MTKRQVYLSLIVPFFNESERIVKTYHVLTDLLDSRLITYELVFVDDGSTDASKALIKKAIESDKNTYIISYKKNKGRGGAIAAGFKSAKGELIGYIDSDLELKPKYIFDCLDKIKNYDGVVVSKYLPKSKVDTTFIRGIASRLFNLWVKIILGSKVTDHQAGLKVFKGDVVHKVIPLVKDTKWLFDVEFLYYAQKMGFTIGEVPVKVEYGFRHLRKSMIDSFLSSLIFVVKLKLNEKS